MSFFFYFYYSEGPFKETGSFERLYLIGVTFLYLRRDPYFSYRQIERVETLNESHVMLSFTN